MTEKVEAKLLDCKSCRKRVTQIIVALCASLLIWQGLSAIILRARMLQPGPTWNGLTVGKSTDVDVVAKWGAPTSIEEAGEIITYTYQVGEWNWQQHQVIIDQDIVEFMIEDTSAYPPNTVMLTDLIAQYGKPNSVQWAGGIDNIDDKIVIFLDEGIFARSTNEENIKEVSVQAVYYYRPRLLHAVLRDFSQYIYRGQSPICSGGECWYYGLRDPWYGFFGGTWPEWILEQFRNILGEN